MPDPTALDAARRAADLTALADGAAVDVVVIGGGITGVGIALDAASRGLRVALVEKHDLAFGNQPLEFETGPRWSALPGDRQRGNRQAQRRRTRNPDVTQRTPLGSCDGAVGPVAAVDGPQRAHAGARRILAGDALRMLAGTPSSILPRSRRVPAGVSSRWPPRFGVPALTVVCWPTTGN